MCLRQCKPHSALHNFDFCHHHLLTCFELDIIIPGEKFDLIHDLELYDYNSGEEFDLIIHDFELYDYSGEEFDLIIHDFELYDYSGQEFDLIIYDFELYDYSGKEFDIIMVQFYDYICSNKHHDYHEPWKELHITVLSFSLQAHLSFAFCKDHLLAFWET
jgi:hypothetical protein